MNIQPKTVIITNKGKWLLDKEIGKGGNGVVWSAHRADNFSQVKAIKFVKFRNKTQKQRLTREVTVQSRLSHNNILSVDDFKIEKSYGWLLMPLCEDATAHTTNKSASEICYDFLSVIDAVKYIHQQNLAHRDIKPDNILFIEKKFVLADFGLISKPQESKFSRITKIRNKIGNFATIAPELRYVEETDVDYRPADIYSLGVTLWMLLCNDKQGFDGQYGSSCKSQLHDYLFEEKLELALLDILLEKSTDKDPNKRPNIQEFSETLRKWLKETDNYNELVFSKWNNLLSEINPNQAKYLAFNDDQNIVEVLNKIVRNDTRIHHCFLPDGGGLDLKQAEIKNNKEVRLHFTGGQYYDCLVKQLHCVHYAQAISESYFFLEIDSTLKKPISSERYYTDDIVKYTELPDGLLSTLDIMNIDENIWNGELIETKSVSRVYRGNFLFVFRFSRYNEHSSTYDARHANLSFIDFYSIFPEPYSPYRPSQNPPTYIEPSYSWQTNPKYIISLKFLSPKKIDEILSLWPLNTKKEDDLQVVNLTNINSIKAILSQPQPDFQALDGLSKEELLELVCLMYVGREKKGHRIHPVTWQTYLDSFKSKKSELKKIIIQKRPDATKKYIQDGMKSINIESIC